MAAARKQIATTVYLSMTDAPIELVRLIMSYLEHETHAIITLLRKQLTTPSMAPTLRSRCPVIFGPKHSRRNNITKVSVLEALDKVAPITRGVQPNFPLPTLRELLQRHANGINLQINALLRAHIEDLNTLEASDQPENKSITKKAS